MTPIVFSVDGNYKWKFRYDKDSHSFVVGLGNETSSFALVNKYSWTMISYEYTEWQKKITRDSLIQIEYDNVVLWMQRTLRVKTPNEVMIYLKLEDEEEEL